MNDRRPPACPDESRRRRAGGSVARAVERVRLAVVLIALLPGLAAASDGPLEAAVAADNGRVGAIESPRTAEPAALADLEPALAAVLPAAPVRDLPVVLPGRDLTTAPSSLWTRIRNGFAMPDLATPAVRLEEDFYANRPDHLRRVAERSRRYLFHVVEAVERRGMPSELALLPIIESAFNPVAVSPARAAGMWQFIPSTGQTFGLRQNWWLDGRRDILLSTEAALDYLQKLYDMFGSWELALAAYNCGEGCVQRAIARNGMRGERLDFSSLQLPAETRAYVPKLQAVKNIVANPSQFGITLADIPNEPFFTTVQLQQHIDVKVAAKLAGLSVDELLALNPAHNRTVINANKLPTLLLPLDRVNQFHDALNSSAEAPLASLRIYSPRDGEPLDAIARRFGITVAALRMANDLPPRARAATGDRDLVVPPAGSALTGRALATSPAAAGVPAAAAAPARQAKAGAGSRNNRPTSAQQARGTRQAAAAQRPASKAGAKPAGKPQVVAQRQAGSGQR